MLRILLLFSDLCRRLVLAHACLEFIRTEADLFQSHVPSMSIRAPKALSCLS